MKFDRTVVDDRYVDNAIIGIRHSFDSESKSDSYIGENGLLILGKADKKLVQKLSKAGPSHRKFLRQIPVSVDITTSLEQWKQLDTYKVGTTANSTSTMHTIHKKPIELFMFDTEGMTPHGIQFLESTIIPELNEIRLEYLASHEKDKELWYDLIGLLPESWMQTRMWTANYEVIKTICDQRRGHRLKMWQDFIGWAHTLPYADAFIFGEEE